MRAFSFILCFVSILLIACGDRSSDEKKKSPSVSAESQVNNPTESLGAKVYKSTCVTCHGAKGKLSVSGSKPLVNSKLNLEQRIEIITKGSRTMLPHRYLGEEKIKAVAEYIEKFKE